MKQTLHIFLFDATFETRCRRDPTLPKDSCAVTLSTPTRPPLRRFSFSLQDDRFRALLWQVLVVGIAVALIAWLWSNAVHNLSARRISTGFAFLNREAGMPIADSWLAYSPKDSYLWAFIVGLVNTLRVAVIGIVLTTMVGTLVGISHVLCVDT
eukprot:Opistho-2@12239